MTVILIVSNTKGLARWTGLVAGGLVATYISLEAPISGLLACVIEPKSKPQADSVRNRRESRQMFRHGKKLNDFEFLALFAGLGEKSRRLSRPVGFRCFLQKGCSSAGRRGLDTGRVVVGAKNSA
jgi:hypothetical protein